MGPWQTILAAVILVLVVLVLVLGLVLVLVLVLRGRGVGELGPSLVFWEGPECCRCQRGR